MFAISTVRYVPVQQTPAPQKAAPNFGPQIDRLPEDKAFDIWGTSGDDSIGVSGLSPGKGQYFNLMGGDGNDMLGGSAFGDRLDGGNGRDILFGNDGNDRLYGGAGDDHMYGGHGNDLIEGGSGNDMMSGGYGADTMNGGDGDDIMFGYGEWSSSSTDGGDIMNGGNGNDQLHGEGGNDVLNGGAGYDELSGGSGADKYVFTNADSTDKVKGFNAAEGDTIDVSALMDSLTNFAGTTAQEAFAQGYLYLVQSQGQTTVFIDTDGGAHGAGDIAVADLMGVNAGSLSSYPFLV